jgi:uncharacterized membrane protein YcaP (DUF421 family)
MDLDWKKILINNLDLTLTFEIALRTLIMFIMVLVFLRLSGKKGVRQLTIFEVAIIIALGSAAGDPMFNEEMAILPSLIVFAIIILVYRAITYLAAKSEKFETMLEGEPMYIIEDGIFTLQEEHDNTFAKDEFFAEMRNLSIEHVGQIRTAILETNGRVSFYYYADEEVKEGLPILPKPYSKKSIIVDTKGTYACTKCGKTALLSASSNCERCDNSEWVHAIRTVRLN